MPHTLATRPSPPRRAAARAPVRRTQAERTAHMRERVLDATVDCLVELGYARTTTVVVTDRAGVSRGAMLHHFPDKESLVVAAVAHVVDRRIAELRDAVARLPRDARFLDRVVDLLWAQFGSPSSQAVLELTVAARTDRALRAHVLPLARRYEQTVSETAYELFGALAPSRALFDSGYRFVYALLNGLALAQTVRDDEREAARTLRDLKQALRLAAPVTGAPRRLERGG